MLDLTRRTDWDAWTLAQAHLEAGDPARAARELSSLVREGERAPLAVRLLLARALFASAQLGRAEEVLRGVVEDHPVEAYAHLLLARTLQRRSRHDEAARSLRLAEALQPGISRG